MDDLTLKFDYKTKERQMRKLLANMIRLANDAKQLKAELESPPYDQIFAEQNSTLPTGAGTAIAAIYAGIDQIHAAMWSLHSGAKSLDPTSNIFPGLVEPDEI